MGRRKEKRGSVEMEEEAAQGEAAEAAAVNFETEVEQNVIDEVEEVKEILHVIGCSPAKARSCVRLLLLLLSLLLVPVLGLNANSSIIFLPVFILFS